MIIRPAQAGDSVAIAAITNAIIRDTLITFTTIQRHPEEIAADIAARGPAFLVALDAGGKVGGFATYGAFRGGPGYAYTCEHSIQLAPAVRGAGMGRALMARIEAVARANRFHVMVGGVSSANPGGVAFHLAMGFEQVCHLPEVGYKEDQWLDLILMQKILHPLPDSDRRGG